MLLGLNNLIVIMLRDADRAKMLGFLTTNRALLGDLLRIAPHTNRMGDMHPVQTLDAILRYFDKYSVVPTESQLRELQRHHPPCQRNPRHVPKGAGPTGRTAGLPALYDGLEHPAV